VQHIVIKHIETNLQHELLHMILILALEYYKIQLQQTS